MGKPMRAGRRNNFKEPAHAGKKKARDVTASGPVVNPDETEVNMEDRSKKSADKHPVSLVTVPFHGGTLYAAGGEYANPGDRPVPLRPACERMSLAMQAQLSKLKGKPWAVVTMIVMTGADGKTYEMACLPLRLFPMWLASINPSKVAPHLRDMLIAYQREAADVLYQHFMPKAAAADTAPRADSSETMAAMMAVISDMREEMRLLRAERVIGVLGKNKAEAWVKKTIRGLARMLAPLDGEAYEVTRPRLESDLRFAVGFFGPWETMPEAGLLAAVQRYLFGVERAIFRRMKRRGKGLAKTHPGQLNLDLRPARQRAKVAAN